MFSFLPLIKRCSSMLRSGSQLQGEERRRAVEAVSKMAEGMSLLKRIAESGETFSNANLDRLV